jgi:outer membrane protein OmpA-like peptidoglycan-associated protein
LQFDANSAALTPESERLMLRWITWLKHFEGDLLTITGYADQDENDPESLSEQRARNVLRFLVAQGLDESRLTVVSNGARRNPFPGVRNEYRMVQNRQVVATPRVP